MPSVFGIVINQFCLLNVSADYLLARRMGWPFPVSQQLMSNGMIEFTMNEGLNRKLNPIFNYKSRNACSSIYQSIINPATSNETQNLYNAEYVKDSLLNLGQNLSTLYLETYKEVHLSITNEKNKDWIPPDLKLNSYEFSFKLSIDILKIQNYLWADFLKTNFISKEQAKYYKLLINTFRIFNDQQIKAIESRRKINQ
jgi:hypothetical protein